MKMDEVLSFIDELLDSNWYKKPPYVHGIRKIKKTTIASLSYRRSALIELRDLLQTCPDHDPVFLIDKYRTAMDNLSCKKGTTENYRYIFAINYEVATEVLDMILVEET